MSDPIYIIDPQICPVDAGMSLKQIWERIQRTLEENRESHRYLQLAEGLEQAYRARAGAGQAEEIVESKLGSPVAQASNLVKPVWIYGLPDDEPLEVLHEVVRLAMQLNLAVFADHLGVAFLPGERIVSESLDSGRWSAFFGDFKDLKPQSKMTRAQMIGTVREMAAEAFKQFGFEVFKKPWVDANGKKIPDSYFFKRSMADGSWQLITLSFRTVHHSLRLTIRGGGVDVRIQGAMQGAPISRFFRTTQAYPFGQEYAVPFREVPAIKQRGLDAEAELEDLEAGTFLLARARSTIQLASDFLVPLLDEMRSPQGLYSVLVRGQQPGLTRLNPYVALASAHLAGAPDFDELVNSYASESVRVVDNDISRKEAEELQQLGRHLKNAAAAAGE